MIGKSISHFKILEKLGAGGMGEVYLAEDTELDRKVAMKFLLTQYTSDPEAVERFKREAKAAASLNHPNIITVYEVGEHEGQTFIAMEYVKGESLRNRMKMELSSEDVLELISQVCQGLSKAHKADIVHRDIKPENIMIDEDDRVRVLDFGLAKLRNVSKLTQTASTLGTLNYMSPEQLQGMEVDARTDTWSVGVILYEMLTGKLPFGGDYEASLMYSILHDEAELISGDNIPTGIDNLISKALAKNAEERYTSIAELQTDLEKIQHSAVPRVATTAQFERDERTQTPQHLKVHHHIDTFFRTILTRRVPQILGLYLGGCWAMAQFVDWMVNKFVLSAHLPDFSLVALLSLLPSVLLMAYFHGKPGGGRWTKVEKISIPVNLLVTASILVVTFSGKDLGSALKTVTLEDEEGNRFERVIPKAEFRKQLVIFPFENTTEDSSHAWLEHGLVDLIITDLYQDLFIETTRGYHFGFNALEIDAMGFKHGRRMPLALKRKIAKDLNKQFFITGSFSFENEDYLVKALLYDTKRGKLISDFTFRSDNLFTLVDDMSKSIRRAAGIPDSHIEETPDLPVSEIATSSLSAYRLYILGGHAWRFKADYVTARALFEQSLQEDSTFVGALSFVAVTYRNLSQYELARNAWRKAMQQRYKLPEWRQLDLKAQYYKGTQDGLIKVIALFRMKAQYYPSTAALNHTGMARSYQVLGQPEKAATEYEAALKIDPTELKLYAEFGYHYRAIQRFDRALHYYKIYAEKKPDDLKGLMAVADTYEAMGEFERAKRQYEKALLVEPEHIRINLALANIVAKEGDLTSAIVQVEHSLWEANTAEDSSLAYEYLLGFYLRRGQKQKVITTLSQMFASMSRWLGSKQIMAIVKPYFLHFYLQVGKSNTALKICKEIELVNSRTTGLGYLEIHLQTGDIENAQKQMEKIKQGRPVRAHFILRAEGKISELRGEFALAAENYEKCLKTPGWPRIPGYSYTLSVPVMPGYSYPTIKANIGLGRCYRKVGELKEAENAFQNFLRGDPFHPEALYELALVYWDMGKKEKALEHLNKALFVWEEADPDYKPAKLAREKLPEWTM